MNNNYIQGKTHKWEVVIGLEVHAQISSKSKLFSRSSTNFGDKANQNVSFVDMAMPGMLPTINKECVRQAVKTGIALNAKINKKSIFERKHYFYPDLPQGYQISQFAHPIVGEGFLQIELANGESKKIEIERLHMEQDAGKNIHGDVNGEYDTSKSYVDLNRAGIGLMEIVTKPNMYSGEEAVVFFKTLRSVLRCIGSCDGNMEEGSMRADVNISLRKPGDSLGTRCEIKNLNSTRFINQAVDFEIKRQMYILENGKKVEQETRLFDTKTGETRTMRSKEDALDYRYFPDPDLPPLIIDDSFISEIANNMPLLPHEKKQQLIDVFGLKEYDAKVLTSDIDYAFYFEKAVDGLNKTHENQLIANWMISELFALLKRDELNIKYSKISPKNLQLLIKLISNKTISGKIAKDVFQMMWNEEKSAQIIINEKGLVQINDEDELMLIVKTILENNKNEVNQYKNGKDRLFGFFVGETMKKTKGKANPATINKLLKEVLNR